MKSIIVSCHGGSVGRITDFNLESRGFETRRGLTLTTKEVYVAGTEPVDFAALGPAKYITVHFT